MLDAVGYISIVICTEVCGYYGIKLVQWLVIVINELLQVHHITDSVFELVQIFD